MKRVIRSCVWESNSSSMHTVSIRGKWDKEVYHDYGNVIEVSLDEYGWEGDPCDDFMGKLAYAMSMVLHTEYPGFSCWNDNFHVNQKTLEKLTGYRTLLNVIRKHQKCDAIIIKPKRNSYYPYGYIDHQSYEDYNSLQDFLDDWNVDAERFLYDYDVVVHIDNDNG